MIHAMNTLIISGCWFILLWILGRVVYFSLFAKREDRYPLLPPDSFFEDIDEDRKEK